MENLKQIGVELQRLQFDIYRYIHLLKKHMDVLKYKVFAQKEFGYKG